MGGFSDYDTALKVRDALKRLVRDLLNQERPIPRYGKVVSVDINNLTALIRLAGDTDTIRVKLTADVIPTISVENTDEDTAEIVKIEGSAGNHHVVRVMRGLAINLPTYEFGWDDYGSGYEGATYRKVSNVVSLQGLVVNPIAQSAFSVIFTLPVGYRPAGHLVFNVLSSAGVIRVDILSTGTVTVTPATLASAWISLSAITFSATA